ncbi:hypothetical protein RCRHEA_37 [Rhodobacter phage RcRhea]|uniref:Uncharacterized protein n=2 Tax=Cronusvirus cronus TaxID=2005060 RepID=A0A0K1LL86_9CAUD|nr:hypothetical protein RCRHEA_37 [Rhodobacter phage RcRhea]AKU43281.1 hypothetical protein RCRHEA_37 [Rhodobacter phage RcRhea]
MAPFEKGPCRNCGAPHPSFGYARKGSHKMAPEKRTTIWVCGKPECKARAEAWKAKADAEGDPMAARRAAAARAPSPPPAPAAVNQPSLF